MSRPKIDSETVKLIKSLPAHVFAKPIVSESGDPIHRACIDYGPHDQVSFPVPQIVGDSSDQAYERLKDWLISDCLADGKCGKQHYQPHFYNYELRWILIPYWQGKINV